jgi:Mg2+ and Co2+ transporter CorA
VPPPNNDQRDWVLIKTRLEHYESCSRVVVTSALGLLSLIESHKSVEEGESARVLALLGTVYLPLSLTAGILSMGGSFTPGQGHFWIFFAVAGPLMVLSLAATYTPTLMRSLMSRVKSKEGKEATRGVQKAPTFVKGSNETV